MPLTLTSSAFADGETIPTKYTRDGDNMMPPLNWTGAPEETRSFALVVEDPDAPSGTFRHLAAYNIPPDRTSLTQSADTAREALARFGRNDFGNDRYDGPEPPHGDQPHHYHFRIAALDVPSIGLPADAGVAEIWKEASKHAIEEADLVGTYQR
jgi:Raf kinase inhibitor-like YbhB/YbcL family protein